MFSETRKWAGWLLILFPILFFSSCNLPIYEDPPPQKQLKFEAGDSQCMDQALVVVEEYFKGNGKPARVSASFDCAVKAIDTFTHSARGEQAGRYSPRELANFFETYLLGGKEISDALLEETMRLKPLFVGGSSEFLTLNELEETKKFFRFLQTQSLNLLPHMKVLSFNWSPDPRALQGQWTQFEKAAVALHKFAIAIGTRVAKNGVAFDLRSFARFIEEVEALYIGKWKFAAQINKYLPLQNQIKMALSGGTPYEVSPQEWRRFLVLSLRSYSLYQRYYYFTAQEGARATQVDFLIQAMDQVTSIMSEILSQKPNQSLSTSDVFKTLALAGQYWPELKVSPLLVEEGFRLKQLFFGGSTESFHKNDFLRVQSKLGLLRPMLRDLSPVRAYLTLENVEELYGTEEARKLQIQTSSFLQKTAPRLAEFLEAPYSFAHLMTLVDEVQRLYPAINSQSWGSTIKSFLPLVEEFKLIFIGAPAGGVAFDQWDEFFEIAAAGVSEFLEYTYFVSKDSTPADQTEKFMFDLIQRGSVQLSELIRKKPGQTLSVRELEALLQAVAEALPNSKYPVSLAREILSFKSLTLGGSVDSLSATEVTRAAKLYSRYRGLWQEAGPYLDYLTLAWNPRGGNETANNKLRVNSEAFLLKVANAVSGDLARAYDPQDVLVLIEKLDEFSGGRLGVDTSALREALPWVQLVNSELLGERGRQIKKWTPLLDWGSQAYLGFLNYQYFITKLDRSPVSGEGLQVSDSLVPKLLKLARAIVSAQPRQVLRFDQIAPFLRKLENDKLLPNSLDAELINDLAKYVFDRLLLTKPQTKGYISSSKIDRFEKELKDWLLIQKDVVNLFSKGSGRFSRAEVLKIWEARIRELNGKRQDTTAHSEMLRALTTPYPLVFNSTDELWLLVQPDQPLYQPDDILAMNWKRVVINLLFEAYSINPGRNKNIQGLLLVEAEELFLEVRDFAIRLGYLAPDNYFFVTSRFLEANIFSSRANGDGVYDFEEGIEQFSLLASGIKINERLTPWVIQSCARRTALETPRYMVDVSIHCVRNVIKSRIKEITRSMPQMGEDFLRLSDEEQTAMLVDIETASNVVFSPGDITTMSNVELLPNLMQYIENLFIRYDRDYDGVIDLEESLRAFPVYKSLLKEFSPLKGDKDLRAIFTFLLKYGEPPLGPVNMAKFIWWRFRPGSWELEVDRKQASRVMAEIRTLINSKGEGLRGLRKVTPQP